MYYIIVLNIVPRGNIISYKIIKTGIIGIPTYYIQVHIYDFYVKYIKVKTDNLSKKICLKFTNTIIKMVK